eukprot:jgi/Botrbrau1/243/Bobra.0022s0218.1
MEDRRSTRIPRPQGAVLACLSASDLNSAAGRKRKAASPLKPVAEVKRVASEPLRATSGPQLEITWEEIAEDLGWTVDDCLNQKVVLKKDAKLTKEILLTHVRRLRAVGWHLHTCIQRVELDNTSLRTALQMEEEKHAQQVELHHEESSVLKASIDSQKEELDKLNEELSQERHNAKDAGQKLKEWENQANQLSVDLKVAQNELAAAREQMSDLQQQVAAQTELHQHAQKYCAQLQDYNSRLQSDTQALTDSFRSVQDEKNQMLEQNVSLKGTISALETQLQASQLAAGGSEAARVAATDEASHLRSSLDRITRDCQDCQDRISLLNKELDRYKECTGKSIESLEKEKAQKAALEGQARVQAQLNSSLLEQLKQAQDAAAVAQSLAGVQSSENVALRNKVATLEATLASAEARIQELEVVRRKLHNTIMELKGNIRVFCRVRPLSRDLPVVEAGENGQPLIQFATTGDLHGRALEMSGPIGSGQAAGKHAFVFDRVFGPASSQDEVFDEITHLVQSALDGYKVCIFAYGQTGSGKTYTMLGTQDERGVIPRAMEQLFKCSCSLEEQGWSFEMKASMLEIYNEEIRDLIGKGPPAGKKHTVVHDDKKGGTQVSFLECVDCKNPGKVKALLDKASRQRAVGATAANEHSSRSHMVFMMSITGTNPANGQEVNGSLNLIDLAGSERLKKSNAEGERLKETQAINKSLSALGDVIAALGSRDASHIPYRNSKLTWLLQNSLGGDAKTLMFVNISPTTEAAAESICSLRFAAKVNSTEIGTARRNVEAYK